MALPLTNSAEGGTNTTTVTTGNSGGGSGNAFDAVTLNFSTATYPTFSSAQAAHGGLSYLFHQGGSAEAMHVDWTTLVGTPAEVWGRFYMWCSAKPTGANHSMVIVKSSGIPNGQIGITTAGFLRLTDGAATPTSTTGAVSIALSSWFRVEFHFKFAATTAAQLKLFKTPDSVTADETITAASPAFSATSINTFWLGYVASTGAAVNSDYYFDEIALNATAYPGPWLGPPNVTFPTGDSGARMKVLTR